MRENDLLARIRSFNAALPGEVILPPGDDMAALKWNGSVVLAASDQILEGVHFDPSTDPCQIGRKALTRNLSDVAAMGAAPRACLANLALPADWPEKKALELIEGLRQCGLRYQCPLIGGDTAIWKGPLAVSVAVLAEPVAGRFIPRQGVRPGDRLFVSGSLGGAWQEGEAGGRHLDFEPRLELGQELARRLGNDLHAMMDLSDGLAADLPRMMETGDAQVKIFAAWIPLNDNIRNLPEGWRRGLNDGEDYELLFAVAPGRTVPPSLCNLSLTCIGACETGKTATGNRLTLVKPDGSREDLTAGGWEHTA